MKALLEKKGHGPHHFILAHGFLGLPHEWDFLCDALSDHITFHLLTLPGHNKAPIDNDIEEFFDSLSAYVQNLPAFSLLGYSLGGRILLEFAIRNLGSIRHIILESSNPGIIDENERKLRLANDHKAMQGQTFENFLRGWYQQALFNPSLDYQITNKLFSHDSAQVEFAMKLFSPGSRPSMWDKLQQFKGFDCHFISGTCDLKYSKIGEQLQQKGWSHHALDSFHNVHVEKPDEYLECFRKLVQS